MDKNNKLELFSKNLHLFKHKTCGKVRFDEVDSFGVAHNLRYFYWLEWARTNYFNDACFQMKPDSFITHFPIMTVHSSADYFKPMKFFEDYSVLTRISFLGYSSLGFENVVLNSENEIAMIANAVLVYVSKVNSSPAPIPENMKKMILSYEGNSVKLIEKAK